jgi:hypothetical protein
MRTDTAKLVRSCLLAAVVSTAMSGCTTAPAPMDKQRATIWGIPVPARLDEGPTLSPTCDRP